MPRRNRSSAENPDGKPTPRVLWNGAITFGLVHVPVELHPAAQRHQLDLDLLDRRTMDPVGYQRVNKKNGKVVPWADIVKGYEYQKGRYVVLDEADFKRANPKATQTVEIACFVRPEQVPLFFYDTPYYLVPGKRGEKTYALLREALRQTGLIGIATVVIQTKQHLAAVVPAGRLLLLDTLRFVDEIRDASGLAAPAEGTKAAGLSGRELEMAVQLVKSMAEAWRPERFHDTYKDDLLARVKAKVKAGRTEAVEEKAQTEAPTGQRPSAEIVDLVALLKNSLHKPAARSRAPAARKRGASNRTAALRKRA
jgi:DNA end-binding protein Ku